jgi:hypothetical protein
MCLILRDLTSQECLKKKKKTENLEVMIYARTQCILLQNLNNAI